MKRFIKTSFRSRSNFTYSTSWARSHRCFSFFKFFQKPQNGMQFSKNKDDNWKSFKPNNKKTRKEIREKRRLLFWKYAERLLTSLHHQLRRRDHFRTWRHCHILETSSMSSSLKSSQWSILLETVISSSRLSSQILQDKSLSSSRWHSQACNWNTALPVYWRVHDIIYVRYVSRCRDIVAIFPLF